jgi:hypothetical protein
MDWAVETCVPLDALPLCEDRERAAVRARPQKRSAIMPID